MKTAIALGTFDGVHLAHKQVLTLPDGYKKIAVVFPMPPKAILSGNPSLITSVEDKFAAIKGLGIDEIYPLCFNEIRDMSPADFLKLLKEKFNPDYISCGFNYHFGKNAAGNSELLKDFCLQNGIELNCHTPICVDSKPVSSTRIRELLKGGEIEKANRLLTCPFSFKAEVIKGDKRGRTIGFPTINQKYPENLVPVKFGVYKTRLSFDNKTHTGITNIGIRPTFKSDYIISETYIIDFKGDLYGKEIKTELISFIREEIKFSSLEELKNQINTDVKKASEN